MDLEREAAADEDFFAAEDVPPSVGKVFLAPFVRADPDVEAVALSAGVLPLAFVPVFARGFGGGFGFAEGCNTMKKIRKMIDKSQLHALLMKHPSSSTQ